MQELGEYAIQRGLAYSTETMLVQHELKQNRN